MLVRALQQRLLRLVFSLSGMLTAALFSQSGANMLWPDGLEVCTIDILLVECVSLRAANM